MSFWTTLESIGKDIEVGIKLAEPIVGAFVPAAGPILADIAAVIADVESAFGGGTSNPAPSQAATSALVQGAANLSTIKQHLKTAST